MMTRFFIVISLLLLNSSLFSQDYSYRGVNNDPKVDVDFSSENPKITSSIREQLGHLNLYEYAHALPELYPLVESGQISSDQWKTFVDSLEQHVVNHKNDTIRPYWAVDYTGLIPMQAQFFLASLEQSSALNARYPLAYQILSEGTSPMKGLGYKKEHFDSLVVFTDVVGTSTFWYFLQLGGCDLIVDLQKKDEELLEKASAVFQNTTIVSTYKVPFFLQKRKLQSIQRMLGERKECAAFADQIFNGTGLLIKDEDKDYYKDALKDGVDLDKIKEF